MQKEYLVDMDKKKELLEQMKRKQSKSIAMWNMFQLLGWLVLVAVILIAIGSLIPVVVESLNHGYIGEALLVFVALIPVMGVVAVIWLIILFFRTHMEKKYLRPWVSYSEEHLWLHRKSMEWGHCNRFDGKYYWMLQMKYEDIHKIEYDEKQHLIRVYGPYSGKKWDSVRQMRCLDSFDAYTDAKPDEHFIFCEYYENFSQLVKDLEEVTGLQAVKCSREMKF